MRGRLAVEVDGRGVLGGAEGGQGGFMVSGLEAAVLKPVVRLVGLGGGTDVHEGHRGTHALAPSALLPTPAPSPSQHLNALHRTISVKNNIHKSLSATYTLQKQGNHNTRNFQYSIGLYRIFTYHSARHHYSEVYRCSNELINGTSLGTIYSIRQKETCKQTHDLPLQQNIAWTLS